MKKRWGSVPALSERGVTNEPWETLIAVVAFIHSLQWLLVPKLTPDTGME